MTRYSAASPWCDSLLGSLVDALTHTRYRLMALPATLDMIGSTLGASAALRPVR